jgi:hypothetical protein
LKKPSTKSLTYILPQYDYSKTLIDCGRIYVKDFGIQKLTRELRGFLIKDSTIDVDIVNCHPTILLNIINKYYPDNKKEFTALNDYVKNRDKWIIDNEISKKEILINMNTTKKTHSKKQMMIRLDNEFKKIQKMFWENIEEKIAELPMTLKQKKNTTKQNKEGRFLNTILTYFENIYLNKVMCKDEIKKYVQTPMFDGFTMLKPDNEEEIMKILNDTTKEEGLRWIIKEHDVSIEKDEGIDITYTSILNYDQQKEKFEKSHFIIENPLLFAREYLLNGESKYQFYSKEKFKDLVKPVTFYSEKEQEFFPEWLKDTERRSYKEIKFIPKIEENEEIFNSFSGFEFKKIIKKNKEDDETMNVVKTFRDHIGLLCNYNEESIEYLFKYICHILQYPDKKPSTAIILKSKQGFGKDTLIDIIAKLIGSKYMLRTAEMDDIFGTYNVGLRDKLILQLNEVEGKDGYSNKEKIKNIITEEQTIIREKYISQYEQVNYLRLWILSNNLNPIEISHDDRRFCVFKAFHKKPNQEYFNNIHEFKDNKKKMKILFNYCMNYDILQFDIRNDRPITEAYNTMQQHNENPLYKYLWDIFIKNGYEKEFTKTDCRKKKDQPILCVKSNVLYNTYKEHLQDEDLGHVIPTFKIMKSILSDVGIIKKSVKINGQSGDYYVINQDELTEQLENFNFDVAIEEYTDDDFE